MATKRFFMIPADVREEAPLSQRRPRLFFEDGTEIHGLSAFALGGVGDFTTVQLEFHNAEVFQVAEPPPTHSQRTYRGKTVMKAPQGLYWWYEERSREWSVVELADDILEKRSLTYLGHDWVREAKDVVNESDIYIGPMTPPARP